MSPFPMSPGNGDDVHQNELFPEPVQLCQLPMHIVFVLRSWLFVSRAVDDELSVRKIPSPMFEMRQRSTLTTILNVVMKNNLAEAKGSPGATQIDAKWTFGGSWDPERRAPFVQSVVNGADGIRLAFSEPVTVKGKPRLRLAKGAIADYLDGSGTNTLRFAPRAEKPGVLDFTTGAIIASEAITRPEQASERLPR